jgi:hypothetical protein
MTFPYLLLEDTGLDFDSQKRKLSIDDKCSEPIAKSARNSYGRAVPTNIQAVLQRKVDSLEAQTLEYQTTWMRT